jgi:hypothetical protein
MILVKIKLIYALFTLKDKEITVLLIKYIILNESNMNGYKFSLIIKPIFV